MHRGPALWAASLTQRVGIVSRFAFWWYRVYLQEKYHAYFHHKGDLVASGVSDVELHTYELMLQERVDLFPVVRADDDTGDTAADLYHSQAHQELDEAGDM